MSDTSCTRCDAKDEALRLAQARIEELVVEVRALRAQVTEALKLNELQAADLERYRKVIDDSQDNHPERVPREQLQLAFAELLAHFGGSPAANDGSAEEHATSAETPATGATGTGEPPRRKRRHKHGRRPLALTNLPVEIVELDPPEVTAAGGEGFVRIGTEVSDRVAYRAASYVRLRIERGKFVVEGAQVQEQPAEGAAVAEEASVAAPDGAEAEAPGVLVAPLPEGVWPRVMADPSAIAHSIVAKYDDILPLHRQERISAREGFRLPRSTVCSWLSAACPFVERITDAMFAESKRTAFCIATDATGAPVRGQDVHWQVFVLVADRDHVLFRYTPEHTSDAVASLLEGYCGHLLSDASAVYDVLHRGGDVIEVCCWSHCRRYFYKALGTDRTLALQPLSLIAELFKIQRECAGLPLDELTRVRRVRAEPVLELLDKWMDAHRDQVDPRGKLDAAIGYYDNQRTALRRFLDDGRLRLDNNVSEGALRKLVLGRLNWGPFANETGLRWYTVFRSLIASCHLHRLDPERYLEEILRLVPHWPLSRVLEISPKYWTATRTRLDDRQRSIIRRPWETAPEDRGGSADPDDQVLSVAPVAEAAGI